MIRPLLDTYRAAFAGLPRAVWLISLAQFVNRSGMMVFPFLALWLTKERGFSAAQAANALALYGAGAIAGALLGGELVDRVGARRVMLASFALSGAGWLVLGELHSPAPIFAMIVVQSVLVESLRPATSSALAHCAAPGERVRAYALHRLAINLGMSFGPTVGGFLAVHSYGALFVTNGCTCLAAGATLWFLFRNEPSLTAPAPRDEPPASRSPWRDGPFLAFLFLMATLAIVFLQINSTFSLYVNGDLGHSEARIGLLLGLNTVLIVLLEMVVVHKLRAVSPVKLLGPGAFLLCAGFALMPVDESFAWLALTVVVWTVGEMLALPLVESIVADRADERSRGRYMGLFTMSFGVSLVVAPIIGMWVYEELGPTPLWIGCGVVGLALWIGFALLGSRLRPIEPARVAALTRP